MKQIVVAALDDVDELIEQYFRAQGEFLRGNPEPVKDLFSHTEDVTGDERRAALAEWSPITGCKFGDFRVSAGVTAEGPSIDGKRSEDGFICLSLTRDGPKFYDNLLVSLP